MLDIPGYRAGYARWSRITALIVAVLLATYFTLLWKRSPRHALGDFGLVQVSSLEAEGYAPFKDSLNLRWDTFACAPTQDARTCSRELEGKLLSLVVPRHVASSGPCSADYGGRAVPCRLGFVYRGFPESVVRLDEGELGLSPERRAWMRAMDPFSHMGEGDFQIPFWIVAWLGGTAAAWLIQPWLRDRRRWLNWVLSTLCFSSGFLLTGFVFLMSLFSMGYAD
jgi:hypothetical protein